MAGDEQQKASRAEGKVVEDGQRLDREQKVL